jgi:putative membrane protein
VLVGALAGLALAVGLFVYYGLEPIGAAFATAGWSGLACLCGVHLISVLLCSLAWQTLLGEDAPGRARPMLTFFWARWLRDSAGNLLAILPAAGEVIAARELTFHGVRAALAGATSILDLTVEMLSQLLFTLLGLAVLVAQRPGAGAAWWAGGGLAVATLAVAGFVHLQRKGLFGLVEKVSEQLGLRRPFESLVDGAGIDAAIRAIYRNPARVSASTALHLAAWIAGAAETWLGLRLMGHPLSFAEAVALESLVFALRTAAFVVPWAAGVQEGGYLMLGALLGLRPDIALALALLKRAREVVVGLPAVIVWQGLEARRLFAGATGPSPARSADIGEPRV